MMRVEHITSIVIKFKTTLLKPTLCDYSDVYILIKGARTVVNTETAATFDNREKN